MRDLYEYLAGNEYPGRGIAVGQNLEGKILSAYFIMGRSENSRNRIFAPTNDGIRTEPFDPDKVQDPSLIIYSAVRCIRDYTILTNGDQTDTIYNSLLEGGGFENALLTRTYEPDAPNDTPRISCVIRMPNYQLSILKHVAGVPDMCTRQFFDYSFYPGTGHVIHTYAGNGNPLPSFEGEPVSVKFNESLDAFTEHLWNALNPENRISLYVREETIGTHEVRTRIINRNQKEKHNGK